MRNDYADRHDGQCVLRLSYVVMEVCRNTLKWKRRVVAQLAVFLNTF